MSIQSQYNSIIKYALVSSLLRHPHNSYPSQLHKTQVLLFNLARTPCYLLMNTQVMFLPHKIHQGNMKPRSSPRQLSPPHPETLMNHGHQESQRRFFAVHFNLGNHLNHVLAIKEEMITSVEFASICADKGICANKELSCLHHLVLSGLHDLLLGCLHDLKSLVVCMA